MTSLQADATESVNVRRWPTERPLFLLVLLFAFVFWVLLAVSLFGIVYAAFIGIFFFVSHVVFIAYLRGSAVRLGPEQMPDLYNRVEELSHRIGLKKTPAVYVMQAGGVLNALATKLFSSNFVVLYSDLLEACGDNTEARDMIIAHELGHLKAGHLRALWVLLPGLFVPFLGSAYSRAREYTCDRYGYSVCKDRDSALIGMAILAAGGTHGPQVNLRSLVAQGEDLNTTWMTLGSWLSSHPPLVDRIAALEPTLVPDREPRFRGTIGALALILATVLLPVGAAVMAGSTAMTSIRQAQTAFEMTTATDPAGRPPLGPDEIAAATKQAWDDMGALSSVVEDYRAMTRR